MRANKWAQREWGNLSREASLSHKDQRLMDFSPLSSLKKTLLGLCPLANDAQSLHLHNAKRSSI